jgi:hypothetical protein
VWLEPHFAAAGVADVAGGKCAPRKSGGKTPFQSQVHEILSEPAELPEAIKPAAEHQDKR